MVFTPTDTPQGAPIANPVYMAPPGGQARRLDNLVVGQPFSYLPKVDGGSGARTFTLSPALGAGLSHNTNTGEISGTPLISLTQGPFTHTVTDAGTGTSSSVTFYLGVKPVERPGSLPITPNTPPTGQTFLIDYDGAIEVDYDGALMTENV